MPEPGDPSSYRFLIAIGVAALIVVLRNSRPRKLNVDRLWVYPAVLVVMLGGSLAAAPPPVTVTGISLLVGGFLIGALLGWQRGRFTRIEIDPATHALTARASPIGMVLILAVLGLKYGLADLVRLFPALLGVPVLGLGDGLIALTIAMMSVQRLEMWLRARRMLEEAKTDGTTITPPVGL